MSCADRLGRRILIGDGQDRSFYRARFIIQLSVCLLGRSPERLLIDFPIQSSNAEQGKATRGEREKSCTLFVVYFVHHHRWHSDLLSLNFLTFQGASRKKRRKTYLYLCKTNSARRPLEYNQLTTLT